MEVGGVKIKKSTWKEKNRHVTFLNLSTGNQKIPNSVIRHRSDVHVFVSFVLRIQRKYHFLNFSL